MIINSVLECRKSKSDSCAKVFLEWKEFWKLIKQGTWWFGRTKGACLILNWAQDFTFWGCSCTHINLILLLEIAYSYLLRNFFVTNHCQSYGSYCKIKDLFFQKATIQIITCSPTRVRKVLRNGCLSWRSAQKLPTKQAQSLTCPGPPGGLGWGCWCWLNSYEAIGIQLPWPEM